ncbi:SDR family NAD(P)-dependent oxidoreductase [Aliifodinibius salicampi]|uniref:SDR family NAD(P)-dependent oxidoreductase n=1 Tax=Fodinibius salicampi TaxID=1920655 RepID=A0ABT3PZ26_9BACT|nr:SDR family NAD(P)-dependent oxidoreductase [Fodinibius salicampi]MCW9713117.1 SDR family NAD(P)-dependent oxidoreductase [Fodinibius salicampi]
MPKKAIITGATSGIGRALAIEMHRKGYVVGATGRRTKRLESLKEKLGDRLFIQQMDVTNMDNAVSKLGELASRMGGLDIIVLNAGISNLNEGDGRGNDLRVIDVNIRGFANLAAHCYNLFEKQGHGQLVGVSSVASLFGWGQSASYNASKAFVNTYLQGYRQKANHTDADITVTNLIPGFVKSEITEGREGLFWIAPTEKAARQMLHAIESRRNTAYITHRWRIIAWLIKLSPQWIWNRM